MIPEGDGESDGLTGGQLRWLVGVGVGLGALLLLFVVAITGAAYFTGSGSGIDGPPDAAFSVLTDESGGDVVANVTHRGGEAAHPDNVVVEVAGERRGTWSELGGQGPGLVGQGHSLRLTDVEPGDEVRILWIGDDEAAPTELDRGRVMDPSES